jgi:hypothetical protein
MIKDSDPAKRDAAEDCGIVGSLAIVGATVGADVTVSSVIRE